ncbi:MAG: hypothetical protein RLZZ352_2468 [Pseudomonadota bacterium]|jgi:hypothetical protein
MSTLQISLAIFGGLVLVGVIAYNTWVTRQNAPRTPAPLDDSPPGAGPDTSRFADTIPFNPSDDATSPRIEPALRDVPNPPRARPPAQPSGKAPSKPQPTAAPVQGLQAVQPAPAAQTPKQPSQASQAIQARPNASADKYAGLDALIDCITPLHLEQPVRGDALIAALPSTRRIGSKPLAIEGQRPSGEWEVLRPDQRYRSLQAGVQLANRAGPLSKIEFSEYVMKVQTFADAVGATPELPDMQTEVARAHELDAFASGRDAQLGFTLRARQKPWRLDFVMQQATRTGFVRGALPSQMVFPSNTAGHSPVLNLIFDTQAALSDDPRAVLASVTLTLEVTHVPRSEQPFMRMRAIANFLAKALDADITDDSGQPLTTAFMDAIGADLERVYDSLDSRDLAAGSPQARRLFS